MLPAGAAERVLVPALAGWAEASARFGGPLPKARVDGRDISTFQQLAREAVRRDPECGRGQAILGYVLGTLDFRIREAAPLLTRAVAREPAVWRNRVSLAQYHAVLGNLNEALQDTEATVRTAPVETGPLAAKASVLSFLRNYDESMAVASAIVSMAPKAQPACNWRGCAHLARREWREYFIDRGEETGIWLGWTTDLKDEWI